MTPQEKARQLRALLVKASASLSDADALEAVELFPAWAADRVCSVGERLCYDGKLYRCVQAHTSQIGWEPPNVPALWTEVSLDEWPEWKQPSGAQDAYSNGAKVSHNDKHWVSTLDGNVWEPGVYGWEVVA